MRVLFFISIAVYLFGFSTNVNCQTSSGDSKSALDKRMEWWEDARFGMFIHWGVYSVFGGEWNNSDYGKDTGGPSAEWIFLRADIPLEEYEKAALSFNPRNYNAAEWVKSAKDAGMKYMVLTSKHHDGFAMFDTKASKWNIMESSNYKTDLIKDFIDECHKQDMRVGLYYSHEKDWYHSKKVFLDTSVVAESYKSLVKTHLKELLTNYGKIDLIWFDMGIDRHKDLNQMCYDIVRKYQPDCIISSRIGNGLGDYKNLGDRELALPGMKGYLESIMTLRLNWGYDRNDNFWKSSKESITMLSKCACRNSNFLLNMGPQPDGRFTPEETIRLKNIGSWTKLNAEAIYGTQGSPFKGEYPWGSITTNGNKVYLHLYNWHGGSIEVPGIKSEIKSACMLYNRSAISFQQNKSKSRLTVNIPNEAAEQIVPVVELILDKPLSIDIKTGPVFMPPIEKLHPSKNITGIISTAQGSHFTLDAEGRGYNFVINENTEYRINNKGKIERTNGFYPESGMKYQIVYKLDDKSVYIITKIID